MNKEFEVTFRAIYIPVEDISVIFKEIYKDDEIKTREVVGFYHGEPDEYSTCLFLNSPKADYTCFEKEEK
jgi:hypothetical protein